MLQKRDIVEVEVLEGIRNVLCTKIHLVLKFSCVTPVTEREAVEFLF